jgi:copper chaperone CopZ
VKAETAIKTAPGVLAVKADYQTGTATVGTQPGTEVPTDKILAAIQSIGYRGQVR